MGAFNITSFYTGRMPTEVSVRGLNCLKGRGRLNRKTDAQAQSVHAHVVSDDGFRPARAEESLLQTGERWYLGLSVPGGIWRVRPKEPGSGTQNGMYVVVRLMPEAGLIWFQR